MIEKTILFKDTNIFYNFSENNKKDTIVFIHPYGSSNSVFKNQIIYFKREFQLILLDLPAHGKSGFSLNVTLKDVPEIIKSILNNHNILKTHIVAIKEGALVAQAFSNIYSHYVSSMILASTYPIYFDTYKIVKTQTRKKRFKEFMLWLVSFKSYKKSLIKNSANSPEGKELFKESMTNFKRKSLFIKRGFKRFYKLTFQQTNFPIYLVCGNEDLDVIKDASLQFERKYNKVILEGYSNTKEVVFLDNQRLFNERMSTFLNSTRR